MCRIGHISIGFGEVLERFPRCLDLGQVSSEARIPRADTMTWSGIPLSLSPAHKAREFLKLLFLLSFRDLGEDPGGKKFSVF